MDDVITLSWLLPFVGFAIYGVECLVERFNGHPLSSKARNSLSDLWSYNENNFFRSVLALETPTGIEMVIRTSKIPDEVLEEIFPKKLKKYGVSKKVVEVADGHKDTVEKN